MQRGVCVRLERLHDGIQILRADFAVLQIQLLQGGVAAQGRSDPLDAFARQLSIRSEPQGAQGLVVGQHCVQQARLQRGQAVQAHIQTLGARIPLQDLGQRHKIAGPQVMPFEREGTGARIVATKCRQQPLGDERASRHALVYLPSPPPTPLLRCRGGGLRPLAVQMRAHLRVREPSRSTPIPAFHRANNRAFNLPPALTVPAWLK